jgi:hypothetical protein
MTTSASPCARYKGHNCTSLFNLLPFGYRSTWGGEKRKWQICEGQGERAMTMCNMFFSGRGGGQGAASCRPRQVIKNTLRSCLCQHSECRGNQWLELLPITAKKFKTSFEFDASPCCWVHQMTDRSPLSARIHGRMCYRLTKKYVITTSRSV